MLTFLDYLEFLGSLLAGISLLKWVFSLVFQIFFCIRQRKKILGSFGRFSLAKKQKNQGTDGTFGHCRHFRDI